MTTPRTRYGMPVALMILAGVLAGCIDLGKGTPRQTRLYVLAAMVSDARGTVPEDGETLSIGVGPLDFPAYLNRSQIVTRTGENELKAAPFANWAEPLEANVKRVLAENLADLTGSEAIYLYPWRMDEAPQAQLRLAIDRFDAERDGEAVLVVRWEWLDREGVPLMRRERTVLRRPVEGDGDEAVVAALSRLMADYSRAAAARLDTLPF